MKITLRDLHKIKRWEGFELKNIDKNWQNLDNIGRFMVDMKIRLGNKKGNFNGIANAWKNEPCFVVGASKNLSGFDLNKLEGYHSVGINHMIEHYDGFEWFIFLDNRFLKRTTYNIEGFKGKIFSSNKCMLLPDHLDWYRFKTKPFQSEVELDINRGLFNGALTGLCALNLALISGANPIYLLGCDTIPVNEGESYHYNGEYNGEINTQQKWRKYAGSMRYYEKFKNWKNKIINVGEGMIPTFKRISLKNFDENILPNIKKTRKIKPEGNNIDIGEIKGRQPVICHMITMPKMIQMGDISRQVFTKTLGKHIFCKIDDNPPPADLYILECFINKSEKYVNFNKPKNSKVISIIHSSSKCLPAKCSDRVISLTYGWQKVLLNKGIKSIVIPAGININLYNKKIDYSKKNFGRITRWSNGKVHPNWNKLMINILDLYKDSKAFIISNNARKIEHKRVNYIEGIKINEIKKKVDVLSSFCVFADMHNTFQETFSLCLLEHMASGHACILFSVAPQPSMMEILDDCGIICFNENDFKNKLVKLLIDTEWKKELGEKAKIKAKMYSIDRMIESYNIMFKNLLEI